MDKPSMDPSRIMNDARETARAAIGEQQQAAASGIGDFAGVLRRAARDGSGQGAPAARLAESAADGLERLSDTLRGKDIEGVMRDVNDFARQQPALFFGAAALAGFLAMRFLKASEPAAPPPASTSPMSTSPSAGIYDAGLDAGSPPF